MKKEEAANNNSNSIATSGGVRVCLACAWDEKYAQQVQGQLKITKNQARRMFEIHKFATLRNEEEYKIFRLEVKQRLYAVPK